MRPPDRRVGHFPFEGGTIRMDERAGLTTWGTILPDGTRTCGATPSARRVLLVGDSYVFGVGLMDRDAFCWLLQDELRRAGADVEVINLGQPGASLHSYVDTLRYGLEQYAPQVVVVSLLPANDVRPVDVNDLHRVVNAPWFKLGGLLVPHTLLWDAVTVGPEVLRPQGWTTIASAWGIDAIAALGEARGVATIPEVQLTDENAGYIGSGYEALLATAHARHASFRASPQQYLPRDDEHFIPGDGHPSRLGNQKRAAWLAPLILAELR